MGEPARFRQIDFSVGAYHKNNNPMRQLGVPTLQCPSFPGPDSPCSSYAGVHHHQEAPIDADNRGILFLNQRIKMEDLVDGPAYTLALGEKMTLGVQDLGWMSGTPATLRNTRSPINKEWQLRGVRGSMSPWNETPDWAGDESIAGQKAPPASDEWTPEEMGYKEGELDPNESADAPGDDSAGSASSENKETVADQPTQKSETGEQAGDKGKAATGDAAPSLEKNKVARSEDASSGGAANAETAEASAGQTPSAAVAEAPKSKPADSGRVNPYIPRGGNRKYPLRVGGFGSSHPGGANFAMADGSFRFINEMIGKQTLQELANRNDGKVVKEGF
jgi:prepilin-type processing-associated H-X9-DG protein